MARGATLAKIELSGLEGILSKLRDDPVYARPWRKALYEALKLGKATAEQRAMRASGKLASRNRYRIGRGRVPLWGAVSNSASRKGFRYGFALNAGHAKRKKSGRTYEFHRRAGGGSTRGWFTGVLDVIQGRVNGLLSTAAKEIESAWRS